MSFKTKKWALWRTVNLTNLDPDLESPGGNTLCYAFPWQGKVLSLCYKNDSPVYVIYDPATNTIQSVNESTVTWGANSVFFGDSVLWSYWGNDYIIGWPGLSNYGSAHSLFYAFDAGFNLITTAMTVPQKSGYQAPVIKVAFGQGWNGSAPTVMLYAFHHGNGIYPNREEVGYVPLGGSYTQLLECDYGVTDSVFIGLNQDIQTFFWAQRGDYYSWYYDPDAEGFMLYSAVPRITTKDGYLAVGDWGSGYDFGPMSRSFGPLPGGGCFCKPLPLGGSQYWAMADSPLTAIDAPWASKWAYMRQLDGGFAISDGDLDGEDHEITSQPVGEILSKGENGWYISVGEQNNSPIQFSVWCLDPAQPGGMEPRAEGPGPRIMGWVGECAIQDTLRLEHVLPFADTERVPEVLPLIRPPAERPKHLVGRDEIYRLNGREITYLRDVKLDFTSYPYNDEDWNFPGMVDGYLDSFYQVFAGSPITAGLMPDYMWGWIGPVGNYVARNLGMPLENLEAAVGEPTHVFRENLTLQDTDFATMLLGLYGLPRYHLASTLDGTILCYTSSEPRLWQMPAWTAISGTVSGGRWNTLVDFSEVERPNLGETNWTVWSITSVPRCRPVPKGGYLVGATLYFDPWDEDEWEWTPGAREATFMDTGHGWVPAIWGYDGPLQNDDHRPVYLTTLDEWSVGRSLYGPDALLLYDDEGRFVSCVNAGGDMHPPDGKEVIVTEEPMPRLIYRVYRHGTYSDYAEGHGVYHRMDADAEIQAPLYVSYNLIGAAGRITPTFQGFVDMYRMGDIAPMNAAWRWSALGGAYLGTSPKSAWSPPGQCYVRQGRGGQGITLLSPGPASTKTGIKGVASRSRL